MGQVERRLRREGQATATISVDDPAAFLVSDIGKRALINNELVRNLEGRGGFEKINRAWMRNNGGKFVTIVELIGWRKDVAKCRDENGDFGYLRKTHILFIGQ